MSEIDDAMEMLGAGYEHPSIEIEAPRKVIERRNGKLEEVERPAFVKMSTGFKAELKDIDEIALKVWLYIALSINRKTGTAWPGFRKIADDTGLAVNTVRSAVERLESKYNLLAVHKSSTRNTIYEPLGYVSANKTVSADDTVGDETVSDSAKTVSANSETVSARREKNAQPELTRENQKGKDILDGMIDIALMPGSKKSEIKKGYAELIHQRLVVRPTGKQWEEFINFAADRQIKDGQPLDKFLVWVVANDYNPMFCPPSKLQQLWDRAFTAPPKSTPRLGQRIPSGL